MPKRPDPVLFTTPILLTREAFARAVFARSGGKCVLCGAPAVCAPCHLDCEHTRVSVEAVREAAGILSPVLPEGFQPGVAYDKWGNRLLEHGLRQAGPLAHDTGMRRALAAGGVLGTLIDATP